MKKNTTSTTAKNTSHLLFDPERKVLDANTAQRMAAKCSDYNDSRTEARNFKCLEFTGVKFNGEDLAGIEAHYAKFENCEFSECKLSRMEAYFAEFSNCTFTNCDLENSNFSFSKISDTVFFNSNLNGADFPFAQGNFSCTGCMMEHATTNNSSLHLVLTSCNGVGFESNCSHLDLDISGCSLKRAELNDSILNGKIVNSDLTNVEMNRSNLSALKMSENAMSGMETEDSTGFEDAFEKEINEALRELEEED